MTEQTIRVSLTVEAETWRLFRAGAAAIGVNVGTHLANVVSDWTAQYRDQLRPLMGNAVELADGQLALEAPPAPAPKRRSARSRRASDAS